MELVNEWCPTGNFRKVDTLFRTEYAYEKELMAALPLTGHAPHKAEMEYRGKFGRTLGSIQHIELISIIYLCSVTCRLATQTVAPTLLGFQVIKLCVQYLSSRPDKLIFYPSNSYGGSNSTRLTCSGDQVEDRTTH